MTHSSNTEPGAWGILTDSPSSRAEGGDYQGPTDDELGMVKAFLEPRPQENVPAQYAHDLAHIAWKAIVGNLAAPSRAEGGEQGFHSLRVSVENDWLHTKFTCTAPEGTLCRMRCTDEDCEYWDDDGTHSLVDSGHCNAKEWFDAVDWLECHESTGYESLLYDGPVDAFWDGENFQWRILAAPSRAEPDVLDPTHDEGCECRTSRKETAVCICDFSAPSRAPEQKTENLAAEGTEEK